MRIESIQINRKAVEGPQKFVVGQRLPIHGVWFEIESVEPKRLTLRPTGLTAGERKKRSLLSDTA